jgi:hypothetical protein
MAEAQNLAGFSNMENGMPWASHCFVINTEWNGIMILEKRNASFLTSYFEVFPLGRNCKEYWPTNDMNAGSETSNLNHNIEAQLFVYGFIYAHKTQTPNCEKFYTSTLM